MVVIKGPTTTPLAILILASSADRARRVSLSSVGFRTSCWAAWDERRRRKEHEGDAWNGSDETADFGDGVYNDNDDDDDKEGTE